MLGFKRLILALAGAIAPGLIGCAASGVGSDLTELPAPLLLREATPAQMQLPAQTPFSIRFSKSSEQAGLLGTADASASATREGACAAKAEVLNGGKASGTTQLGHLFKNDTNRQVDVTVRAKFHFEYSATITPDSRLPGATVYVMLYARDQRNRLLREFTLTNHTTEQGAAVRKSDEDVTFTLTLAPQDSISVFTAGQVDVDVPQGRNAVASLSITGLQLDVSTKPSPASQPASQPAPAKTDGPR